MNDIILKGIVAGLAILSDESKWTKGTMARVRDSITCSPCAYEATCWCAIGSILGGLAVGSESAEADAVWSYLDKIVKSLPGWETSTLVSFNDHTIIEYEHVIAMLTYARDYRTWELETGAAVAVPS